MRDDHNDTLDAFLSRKETAHILRISLRTLRRLELRGELPPRVNVTERIFGWRESQIREFLDARTRS
jgi:predicted DNA-binding transcriptional regulator AlpA